MRLVWDQEAAGSNPVSPILINTGTMKKFSQYINSQIEEALSFGMPLSMKSFAKGAAVGLAKKVGMGALSAGLGQGAADIVSAGKEGDIESAKVVDAKLGCKERELGLKKQIATAKGRVKTAQNRGDPDEEKDFQEILDDLELELQHHQSECGKIQGARSMHDVEKAKLRGSQERLTSLGGKP